MKVKIFLDDFRVPKDCVGYMHTRIGAENIMYTYADWEIVRNYDEFVCALRTAHDAGAEITHVSFDHDLSEEHYDPAMQSESELEYDRLYETFVEKTGLECAKFLKEMYERQGKPLPIIFVHSMNPVGVKNIQKVFA